MHVHHGHHAWVTMHGSSSCMGHHAWVIIMHGHQCMVINSWVIMDGQVDCCVYRDLTHFVLHYLDQSGVIELLFYQHF